MERKKTTCNRIDEGLRKPNVIAIRWVIIVEMVLRANFDFNTAEVVKVTGSNVVVIT
ncbi:hypothetical protein LOAG_14654 [Loa loa]|uniref:Uncharacterized protein n=1 Tax=Loa loa TaxID=7209 RepID=A0A1S0THE1_LOALO|nr:hypothetical protein LOAG_14654 [Loa loa]EFO13873.1 hypothetical protein LOAG_14654 [Loa loa]